MPAANATSILADRYPPAPPAAAEDIPLILISWTSFSPICTLKGCFGIPSTRKFQQRSVTPEGSSNLVLHEQGDEAKGR